MAAGKPSFRPLLSVVSFNAILAVPAGNSTGGPHHKTGLPISLAVIFRLVGTALFSRIDNPRKRS
jgi:hypothetical protein